VDRIYQKKLDPRAPHEIKQNVITVHSRRIASRQGTYHRKTLRQSKVIIVQTFQAKGLLTSILPVAGKENIRLIEGIISYDSGTTNRRSGLSFDPVYLLVDDNIPDS
jgi:hypothetical protein